MKRYLLLLFIGVSFFAQAQRAKQYVGAGPGTDVIVKGALVLPRQNVTTSDSSGAIRYNTVSGNIELFSGVSWIPIHASYSAGYGLQLTTTTFKLDSNTVFPNIVRKIDSALDANKLWFHPSYFSRNGTFADPLRTIANDSLIKSGDSIIFWNGGVRKAIFAGVGSASRFGVSGEDERATANRNFSLAKWSLSLDSSTGFAVRDIAGSNDYLNVQNLNYHALGYGSYNTATEFDIYATGYNNAADTSSFHQVPLIHAESFVDPAAHTRTSLFSVGNPKWDAGSGNFLEERQLHITPTKIIIGSGNEDSIKFNGIPVVNDSTDKPAVLTASGQLKVMDHWPATGDLSGYVPTTRTLNGLALSSNQTLATGTSGTNFNISSSGTTHTFNIPDASASARGLITTGTQTIAGNKTFSGNSVFSGNITTNDITLLGGSVVNYSTGGNTGGLGTATLTTSRSWTLPNNDGIVALTSDIPTASNYISNQTSQQSSSNFNISGSGTLGKSLTIKGALYNQLSSNPIIDITDTLSATGTKSQFILRYKPTAGNAADSILNFTISSGTNATINNPLHTNSDYTYSLGTNLNSDGGRYDTRVGAIGQSFESRYFTGGQWGQEWHLFHHGSVDNGRRIITVFSSEDTTVTNLGFTASTLYFAYKNGTNIETLYYSPNVDNLYLHKLSNTGLQLDNSDASKSLNINQFNSKAKIATNATDLVLGSSTAGEAFAILSPTANNVLNIKGSQALINTTTASSYNLDVSGTARVSSTFVANSATAAETIQLTTVGGYPGMYMGSATPSTTNFFFKYDAGATTNYVNAVSGGALLLSVAGTEKARVNSSGFIATNIYGGTASAADLNFSSTTNGTKHNIYLGASVVVDEVNSRLGIGSGALTPSATLTVDGNMQFIGNNDLKWLNNARISMFGNDMSFINTNASGNLVFSPNSTERARFTSGGNLLLGTTTDNSKLTVNGSFATAYVSKSADYTATASDETIEVTATGKTITLPTAASISGRIYTIKLTASGTGTVATTSSQTIDGSTTYSLSAQYKYVTVQSNGSNWNIIANN